MKKTIQLVWILLVTPVLIFSCAKGSKYTYAIKDFRSSLQPYLTRIVTSGVVNYDDSAIKYGATDSELQHLIFSEHPVLRAEALRESQERAVSGHFEMMMGHLDDTAIVYVNLGEWGYQPMTISDYMLQNGKWKTIGDRNKTIDAVLTEHNYLRLAYKVLERIEPQDKYYSLIKEMCRRERPFDEIESALLGLAKFKKQEDIKFIQTTLLENTGALSGVSFKLMQTFPDESYCEVLKQFYNRVFYRTICGYNYNHSDPVEFMKLVASYKNQQSAGILHAMFFKKPFVSCNTDTTSYKIALSEAILNNSCAAYAELIPVTQAYKKTYDTHIFALPDMDKYIVPVDTSAEPVRWQ